MIYGIKTMGGMLFQCSEEEIKDVIQKLNRGDKFIRIGEGILNSSSIDSIFTNQDAMRVVGDMVKYGKIQKEAEKEVLELRNLIKFPAEIKGLTSGDKKITK